MTEEVKVFETPVMTITKVLDYETVNGFRYLREGFLEARWADVVFCQKIDYGYELSIFVKAATKEYAEWLLYQVERLS